MEILIYVLIAFAAGTAGFLVRGWFSHKIKNYSGTISVNKDEDKIVYSLELYGDPEELQFKNEVVFKVNASD